MAENLECFAGLYEAADPTDRIDRALRAAREPPVSCDDLADRVQRDPPTLGLALGGAAALLLLHRLGWRVTSATFDRERLITGTR